MISLPFSYKPFQLVEKNESLFIKHPGAVVILMTDDSGRIALVSQHRPVIDKITLELPAGKIEEGEKVEDAVRREAVEETGYEALDLKHLLSFYPEPSLTDEILNVYICDKGERLGQHLDEDEFISLFFLNVKDVIKLIKKKEIIDLKTVIALGIALGKGEIEANNSKSDKISYNKELIENIEYERKLVILPNFYKVSFKMPNGVENYKYYLKEGCDELSYSIRNGKLIIRKGIFGENVGTFYPSFALTDKYIKVYKGEFEDGEECDDTHLLLLSSLATLLS